MITRKIIKLGNSLAIIIGNDMAKYLDIKHGDTVTITPTEKSLVITK